MIFSKTRTVYGGDDPNKIIEGYCAKCEVVHSLPAKDWIIELRDKKIKLMCVNSLNRKE